MKTFQGQVIPGVSIGSTFGMATANLQLVDKKKLALKKGVYFVKIYWKQSYYKGLLHYGARQTFGGEVSIEVHILDFSQDIYGERLEIKVFQFERETQAFPNADALFTQIEKDVIQARKYFLRQDIYKKWNQVYGIKREEHTRLKTKNIAIPNNVATRLGKKAVEQISQCPLFQTAQRILAYAPIVYEIPFVEPLCLAFPQKHFFFPKIQEGVLKFYRSEFHDLKPGKYGIPEPVSPTLCADPTDLDLVLVPALAVDKGHNRLGRGGGFYDRFLGPVTAPKITVIPRFALVEKTWPQSHDQKVDEIIVIK